MFLKINIGFIVVSGLILCINAHGQTIVGMGTDNPNPNAVLELVSKHQNQGFLMPRLTTSQRNASSFTALLSSKDNGLLVFDTDEGLFYYWYKDKWQAVGQGGYDGPTTIPTWLAGEAMPRDSEGKEGDFYLHQSTGNVYRKQENTFILIGNLQNQGLQYAAGTGIQITDQNEIVNTGDIDPANELQHLNLSGSTLSLSGSPSTVDLSVLQDGTGTDSQILFLTGNHLFISGGNSVDISSINTDNQDLSHTRTGENVTLNISGGTATTFSVADDDNDATNEVQDLSLSSHELKITNNASATAIDLSPYLDNTDSQSLSLTGDSLTISGGNSVDLSPYLDNTDRQDLSHTKTGENITLNISGGAATTFSVADDDNDATNEVQDLSLSSHELKITNNASATAIDLSPYLDNTDNQDLSHTKTGEDVTLNISGGAATTFSVADNDSSVSNETITNATLNVNTLEITEAGTTHTVDLSSIKGSTYTGGEGISVVGTTVAAKADNVTIGFNASQNLKVLDNGITDAQIANVAPSKLLAEGAVHGNVLTYNSGSGKWEPIAPSASAVTRYYSVDPTDFVSVNGASNMEYNGVNGGSASIDGGTTYMIAPIHLPQGAVITEVRFYVYNALLGLPGIACSLQSKVLGSEATTDHVTKNSGILVNTGDATLTATGLNIPIDNSTNSYRIKAEVGAILLGLGKHKVYGARITYTEIL